MKKVSASDIQKIKEWLQNCGMSDTTLSQELTDHIACDLEQQMLEGQTFDEALKLFSKNVSVEEIRKAQERKLKLRTELKKLRNSNLNVFLNIVYMAGIWFATNPDTVSNRGVMIYGGLSFFLWTYSMIKMILNHQKRKELLKSFELGK